MLGKVFWAGALAEMGGRELDEVEQALHELSRKELVRPARTSSMEGEHEYAFWHVLVRDVCYGQIPRAARATRHQAAAAWIERKAGERVEDLADVLAHHYLAALELARAAGQSEATHELQTAAIRYLALAGERALPLDVERAEAHLDKALELAPADDPQRADLLERWAQAAQQQGRLREAKEALEEAVAIHRDRGKPVAAGGVLARLALVLARLGDPRVEEALAEARELLEAHRPAPSSSPPTRTPRAAAPIRRDMRKRSRPPSGRSRSPGARPARAGSRAQLARPRPLPAGASRRGRGRAAGAPARARTGSGTRHRSHLRPSRRVVWSYHGPQSALDTAAEGIAFCERRGITEMALQLRANTIAALADLGQTEQALLEAGSLADRLEAAGDMAACCGAGAAAAVACRARHPRTAPAPEKLVSAARDTGLPSLIALTFAAAAQLLLARRQCEQAQALLAELDQLDATRVDPDYAWVLPSLLRVALALDDRPLAERLSAGVEPVTTAPRTRRRLGPGAARRSRGRARRRRRALRRGGRALARVRERPRARLRPPRPGPLPRRARQARGRGAASRGARALRVDGLRAGARGSDGPAR